MNSLLSRLQPFLSQTGSISFKYRKLNELQGYNVFHVMFNQHDEVHLHSKFIADLLSPSGFHRSGTRFLEEFIQIINARPIEWTDVWVETEYRNIDVFIANSVTRQAIIIENKIWATDQPKQLERYAAIAKAEGYRDVQIFYLSPHGREPEEQSRGILSKEDVSLISYSVEISKWVERCMELSIRNTNLLFTLTQYHNLVADLTGQNMNEEQKKEMFDLMGENDNALKAKEIVDSWIHVRWFTEWNYWKALETAVSSEYLVLPHQKYSEEKLNSAIYGLRNRDYWYGIQFEVGRIENESICLFIERGQGSIYFGLTANQNGNRDISDLDKFVPLVNQIAEYCEWPREKLWLGGCYCTPNINFNAFIEENTLRIVNKQNCHETAQAHWKQIQRFIKDCGFES